MTNMPSVVLANDHGAVELATFLMITEENRYEVNYLGVKTNDSVDYPDMAKAACEEYKKGGYDFGILLCGTGIGISISANKVEGIRCALPQNSYAAAMAKKHNNATSSRSAGESTTARIRWKCSMPSLKRALRAAPSAKSG
jgi:ribose 5-phosphate isomerase B